MKSYEEMAEEAERVKDTEKEIEGLVPVKTRLVKNPRVVTSVRLSPEETKEILAAAKASGVTVSEYLRTCALTGARGQLDVGAVVALEETKGTLRQLLGSLDSRS